MKTTVLIVDDHQLIREAWCAIINSNPNYSVIEECSSGNRAVELALLHAPDIILMDINMPDLDGIETTRQIRHKTPSAKIIGVSAHTHTSYVRRIIKEGAMGYVTKTSSSEELFTAMHEVRLNKRYLCGETKDLIAEQAFDDDLNAGIHSLSKRELQIIRLLKQGLSSKEIGERFSISTKTVEVHRCNILRKLNINNTAALVNYLKHHFIN